MGRPHGRLLARGYARGFFVIGTCTGRLRHRLMALRPQCQLPAQDEPRWRDWPGSCSAPPLGFTLAGSSSGQRTLHGLGDAALSCPLCYDLDYGTPVAKEAHLPGSGVSASAHLVQSARRPCLRCPDVSSRCRSSWTPWLPNGLPFPRVTGVVTLAFGSSELDAVGHHSSEATHVL